MPGLPTVGASEGVWGSELNAYLLQEHDDDGGHDNNTFIDELSAKLLFNANGEPMVHDGAFVYLKES